MKRKFTVFAPAKVNLRLEIGARRADGFHDAVSVMQALTLHDTVTVTLDDGVDDFARPEGFDDFAVDVKCVCFEGVPELDIPAESNIAYKAAVAMAQAANQQKCHIGIHIEKHIPHQAGLGGGSSDAAAVIAALAKAWGMEQCGQQALQVAQSLGADVAFFLHGGCARLGGKGDEIQASLAPAKGTVVLVKLEEGVSTKAAYEAFDALPEQPIDDTAKVDTADELPLFNNLAAASEVVLPELAQVRTWLAQQEGVARDANGTAKVLLCGSGSCTFAIMDAANSVRNAVNVVAAAKKKGHWARSCSFSPVGTRVLEGAGDATNLGAPRKIW